MTGQVGFLYQQSYCPTIILSTAIGRQKILKLI